MGHTPGSRNADPLQFLQSSRDKSDHCDRLDRGEFRRIFHRPHQSDRAQLWLLMAPRWRNWFPHGLHVSLSIFDRRVPRGHNTLTEE